MSKSAIEEVLQAITWQSGSDELHEYMQDRDRKAKAETLREVLAWAEEHHPWIGLMDLKEHLEDRADELEGKP